MERAIHLSLLWAAFSVLSRMVSVAGSRTTSLTPLPPAPELSLSPPHNIFVPGERVQLACSPPEGWRAEEFWFYKLKPGDQWDLQLRQKEGTWELEVSTAHLEPQTTFVCTYSVGKSAGELLHSAQSNLCPVSILELPPAALSLDPKYPVYLKGERVTLTCSAPEGRQVSGYLFYKEEPDRSLRELPHTGRGPYEAFRAGRSTAGKYRCAYWIQLSGRGIQSPHSGPVSIAVTADTVPEPSAAVLAAHTYETDSPGDPARQLTSSQPAAEEKSHSAEADGPVTSAPSSSQSTSHRGISRGRTLTWLWHLVVAGSFFAVNGVIFLITLQDW